jgi:hypothetical protein
MLCCHRDEIAIAYLLSLDDLENAQREASQDRSEIAAVSRLRLEAHRLYVLKDLLLHCRAHGCATAETDDLVRGASGCERDELIINYIVALDELADARREEARAFTVTRAECAATRRERLEAHKLSVLDTLASHCAVHGCLTPELAELTGLPYQPSPEHIPEPAGAFLPGMGGAPEGGATARVG